MTPRVVVVSHAYTAAINRAKLGALAQHVALTAIVPARWQDALFTVNSDAMVSADYELRALPIRFGGHILRYLYPFRALARTLRETRPDLVCVEEEPASLALAQVAWLKRKYKLVFFSWENISQRGRALAPIVERWNLSRSDGALAGSADAAAVLRAKKFSKPIAVIPQLGVDEEKFSPARSNAARDHFVVGYVGRLAEEKGLWTLLQAVECLTDVRVALVGAGPLRDALARWIRSSELSERIQIRAAVPHQAVPRVLNDFDALVLASRTTPRWKEQFGHVLIEAMACGIPVIGSDSGAIPEVLADAGIIFPEGKVAGLRNAIIELRKNSARRAQLAQAGRARVLAHYTHAHIAAQNAEFFQRILAR